MGRELSGKTLGVIGMGRIGSQVVSRCKAFNMEVLVNDPYITEEVASRLGAEVVDRETLFKNADVITIHVPLTPETKHSIGEKEFHMMKEDAFIINCARGGIINEEDLYHALKDGKIGASQFPKVRHREPLLSLDNLVATPHIGASTKEAQRDAAIIVAREIIKVLSGNSPMNVLNMPVLDSDTLRLIKPYFDLMTQLGRFLIQTAKGNIKEISVTYSGQLADYPKLDILTRMLLQEILNPILTEPVNLVNAMAVAENRGITVIEGKRSEVKGHDNLIQVEMKSESNSMIIDGVSYKEPRIVMINGYKVDVETEGNLLICTYQDIPGVIGAIGTKLGEHGINIAKMLVGRQAPGGEAVMVVKIDQTVLEDVLDELKKLDRIYEAVVVTL
jgi:D-3-phosphoglycerate dehydrogenase